MAQHDTDPETPDSETRDPEIPDDEAAGREPFDDETAGREAPDDEGADRDDLDREAEELGVAVMATSRLFVAISARALASTAESLTLPQLRALVVLDTCGPVKLVALAATLGVNPSTALRMVGRLEALDLVDRRTNPDNRREVVLSLTAQGHDLVTRVLAHRRAEIRKLVQRLPAEERAALVPALRALTTAAGEMAVEAYDTARAVRGIVEDPLDAAVPPRDT
ncbi:MarR family winged helix-turn-helix transcriptional regulator [Streptomyces anandii]|uniref:MarR family winged helix-turn-helix transcriptional regulator n=1 Tax=Streptomyces anandii TaxID=285454 RepID=UPI0036F8E663